MEREQDDQQQLLQQLMGGGGGGQAVNSTMPVGQAVPAQQPQQRLPARGPERMRTLPHEARS